MTNQSPKISVIVPVYNVQKYLSRCIDSILSQTFTDFELLLIDDGSKDNSGKICDEYAKKDERIKVFHEENRGVSSARNKGIENAFGKYISFIDSDDDIIDTYLEVLYQYIQKCDIVFFQNIWINEDQTKLQISLNDSYSNDPKSIEEEILFLMHNDTQFNLLGYTWNKIFRSHLIKEHNIRFVENLAVAEDEIFTLDYCRYINNLMVLNAKLYNYYCKKDGLTYKQKSAEEWDLLAKSFINLLPYYSNIKLKRYLSRRIAYCLINSINIKNIFTIGFYSKYKEVAKYSKIANMNWPYKEALKIIFKQIIKKIMICKQSKNGY